MKRYILLFSFISYMGMAQMAAQEVVQSVVPTVNVVGEASIEATPTLVNISVSIEGEGKDAKLLSQSNSGYQQRGSTDEEFSDRLRIVVQELRLQYQDLSIPHFANGQNKIGQLGKIRNPYGRSL